MDDPRVFEKMDEQERIYAPENVPGTNIPPQEVDVGGAAGSDTSLNLEPAAAAPIASPGTTQNTLAAPPNIGHMDDAGAPGVVDPDAPGAPDEAAPEGAIRRETRRP